MSRLPVRLLPLHFFLIPFPFLTLSTTYSLSYKPEEDNLSKEKELRELVNEVTQLQNQLTERRRALEALKQRQEEISQRHTSYLPLRLKEAADRAEVEISNLCAPCPT